MKEQSKLERYIRQVQVDTDPATDDQVLADMQLAHQSVPTPSRCYGLGWGGRCIRTAALIVLVLGVGFVLGRRQGVSPEQMEDMRVQLEQSLTQALAQTFQEAVLEEVNLLVQETSQRTLAVSEAQLNQRLHDLIQLTEAARLKDRKHVAEALERLVADRLQDKHEWGQSLTALAVQTRDYITNQTRDAHGS